MMDNTLEGTSFCPVNETEISHVNQDVEITLDIEKPDSSGVSDSPTISGVSSVRVILPETIASEESVSCENYRNKGHGYTKCTNPVVEGKHFEVVSSTSSTNNYVEKVNVNKLREDQKTQLTNNYTFEQIENELRCSICRELFIKATTLNCSHSFCTYCIKEWYQNDKKCPKCRMKITTANPTIILDNFIGKILESAPDNVRKHRDEIIKYPENRLKFLSARKKNLGGAARMRSRRTPYWR
ncbi:putative E3 ubiquitin-protein ligase [Trypoxylus dichotomus]